MSSGRGSESLEGPVHQQRAVLHGTSIVIGIASAIRVEGWTGVSEDPSPFIFTPASCCIFVLRSQPMTQHRPLCALQLLTERPSTPHLKPAS